MRIVAWNIRAGGGVRSALIADQIRRWRADVVALSEFRGTPASQQIARQIGQSAGLQYQRTTVDPLVPARNALLVASRWPVRMIRVSRRPLNPYRWLQLNIDGPEKFSFAAVHVPNRVTGRKTEFLDAVSSTIANWRGRPGIIAGDTNSGRIGIDEENPAFDRIEDAWMQNMERLGWRDAYRSLHPTRRSYTWYSPNGRNGFRLDQAFIHDTLWPRVRQIRHVWAGATAERKEVLSDHAALILDFD